MGHVGDFRSGQKVRIRSSADSDFAGYVGTVMHVGGRVCDVKIRYRPEGSKVWSIHIGTFNKDDLESLRKPVDLAMFEYRPSNSSWGRVGTWLSLGFVLMVLLALVFLFVS
jgi:hypothetical protein